MPLTKNQTIPLTINSIASDGNGVGRYQNMVVFVPLAATGDELQVKIVKVAKNHAFGRIEACTTPGAGRQPSNCPVSEICGGCTFRHLTYEAELEAKNTMVKDALQRIGKFNLDDFTMHAPLGAPSTERYRNKMQFPLAQNDSELLEYGIYAKRSHRLVTHDDCLLVARNLNGMAKKLTHLLNEYAIPAYNERDGSGEVRYIAFRLADTGDVLVTVVSTKKHLPHHGDITRRLTQKFPEITGVTLNTNLAKTNVIMGRKNSVLYGDGTIKHTVGSVPTHLDALAFAQINTAATEILLAKASDLLALDKNTDVLDLFCGTGVIGLSMAEKINTLVGVDNSSSAIKAAKQSADEMGVKNTRFICDDATKAAHQLAKEGYQTDALIIDPPRKGAGDEMLKQALTFNAPKVLMVSCNPATLARDLRFLTAHGYTIQEVQPLDMFPRTAHVECVVLITRKND